MSRNKLQDGESTFVGGVNSALDPTQLPPGFYSRGMNVVHRGGIVQCRPGYRCKMALPEGRLQGFTVFTPKIGAESMLFVVAGRLYVSAFPFKEYRQVPDVSFSDTAKQVYFKQVEQSVRLNLDGSLSFITPRNLMVIQDGGQSKPVVFDGATAHTNSGIPLGGAMEWVADRLWVARGSALYASDIANPLSFTENLYIASPEYFVLPSDITGLSKTTSIEFPQLLVFTRTSTTLIQAGIRNRASWAATPDFQREVLPHVGCVSSRSIVAHHGILYWFSKYGLTSLDTAMQANSTTALPYRDAEMTDSKARLSEDLSGVASAVFENYLLCSVPFEDKFNRHTWVLDTTPIQASGEVARTWSGFWTGTRPVEWASTTINGVNRIYYISVDYDGNNRLWEAFTPDRLDNGCPITWYVETRALSGSLAGKYKDFRYSELFISELCGDVDIAVFWAGSHRGKYKKILAKRIRAARGSLSYTSPIKADDKIFALKKQSRFIRTQDGKAISEAETLSSCGVESPNVEFLDFAFQLLIVGSGPGALRGYLMYMDPPLNTDDSGACDEDETDQNFVRFDGAAADADSYELARGQFSSDIPKFTSYKTVALSQEGYTAIGSWVAKSIISQADADKVAEIVARRFAAHELEDMVPKVVSLGAVANEL